MRQKFKIDRDFLRSIQPTGKYQEFVDFEVRGFGVKVTPTGTVTYTVRWTKPDGKQGRKVIGYWPNMNPGEARELARKTIRDVDKKGDTTADVLERRRRQVEAQQIVSGHTLRDFIDTRYRVWMIANNRSGEATVTRAVRVFADFLDHPLNGFNPWMFESWRAKCLDKGLSTATTNRDLAALRGLFSRAVEWGVVAEHPMRTVKALKESSGKVRWLSDDEEDRLRIALDAREERERSARDSANAWRKARGYELLEDLRTVPFVDYLKPAVLLSLNTGMRQGELLKLRWGRVDLENSILTVSDETAKSGKQRHIPLNDEALAALKQWRQQQSRFDVVFAGDSGAVRTDVKTAWARLLKDAQIQDFRWHDMRHHFASRLVMAGVDLNTVRELLGHSDMTMTLRYAHLAPEHKAAAVAKLGRRTPVVPDGANA
ncbi:hypothetical protein WL32_25245 [Burkholderia cepacia]|uniref:site-specific integrase n=1 Tax=Burkholderia cepacia TaxID=292 RepID=UPI00075A1496|nr:site-specific integrase [Burkholderia cepacia]KWB17812.1 hypothetical protein WL32_25245 [Burkholderia cepacia]